MKVKIKVKIKETNKLNKYAEAVKGKGLTDLRKLGYSDGAIVIIERLEFWFRKYPDGFDRHFEERIDQANLDGECLSAELGMEKSTFKKYFKEIGIRYLSVEKYLSSSDKFEGKLYCSVLDTDNHKRTKYYRNHQSTGIIEIFLNQNHSKDSDNLNMGVTE